MAPCRDCTVDASGKGTCPDPLKSVSEVCSDHYMTDCERWWAMCKAAPVGLAAFCGKSLYAVQGAAGGGGDAGQCFGVMRMYFHTGGNDFVLFKGWVPCSDVQYAFTFLAVVFAGALNGLLKAMRARYEQQIMQLSRRADSPETESDSGVLFPGSMATLRHNTVRAAFTFINMLIDYSLMLISMTFNVGLFFAVIIGISIGTLFFGHTAVPIRPLPKAQNDRMLPSQYVVHGAGGAAVYMQGASDTESGGGKGVGGAKPLLCSVWGGLCEAPRPPRVQAVDDDRSSGANSPLRWVWADMCCSHVP